MKSFWLFRTNLRPLEYYHRINNLEQFKKECHDFYLLQGIWFLENDAFDEVVIWRLRPEKDSPGEIAFNVNGKKFIQRFVNDFNDCFYYPKPHTTFFRGGFPEYAQLTNTKPAFFGLKLYYGAGKRIYPQHGGRYDKILVEDKRDYRADTAPFYKTANSNIFYPTNSPKTYDLSWIFLDTNDGRKGKEWFIKQIPKSEYLKSLKILQVGCDPSRLKRLCKKHGVDNIACTGLVEYDSINMYLNTSKASIVTSNMDDGSPRIITETLMSGIPLVIRDKTKRTDNLIAEIFNDSNAEEIIEGIIKEKTEWWNKICIEFRNGDIFCKNHGISMNFVCKKNLEAWE